jgi:hypothetical protein
MAQAVARASGLLALTNEMKTPAAEIAVLLDISGISRRLVEQRGIEPLTSALRTPRSPN